MARTATRERAQSPQSPKRNKTLQREKVLRAALKVYLKKGFHATRVEDVVREAGASKNTFYVYFASKEAALETAFDAFLGELRATLAWTRENVEPAGLPIGKVFETEADRILATMMRHQDVARLMFHEGRAVSPRISRKITEFTREMMTISKQTIKAAVDMQLLPQMDPEAAAASIVGACLTSYALWLDGEIKGRPEFVAREIFSFLLRGCGLQPSALG